MSADEYMQRAILKLPVDNSPLRCWRGSRQHLHVNADRRHQPAYGLVMLRRQYLRRRHHARLCGIVESDQHAQQSHKSLAAAHIALQQAIHLPARSHIGPDLLDHPLLRSRQFERHAFLVESIEIMADVGESHSFHRKFSSTGVLKYIELKIKQLVKFHSRPGHIGTRWR